MYVVLSLKEGKVEFWVKGKRLILRPDLDKPLKKTQMRQVTESLPRLGRALRIAVHRTCPGRTFALRFIDSTLTYFKAIIKHR